MNEFFAIDTEQGTLVGIFSTKEAALEEALKQRAGWKEIMNEGGWMVLTPDPQIINDTTASVFGSASKGAKQIPFILRIRPIVSDILHAEAPNGPVI